MTKKALTREEILHLAKLANITLTDEEVAVYAKQLSEILAYIDQLNKIDTENARRGEVYAKKLEGMGNLIVNRILTFGVYSKRGARESAQKIREGIKLDSGSKH